MVQEQIGRRTGGHLVIEAADGQLALDALDGNIVSVVSKMNGIDGLLAAIQSAGGAAPFPQARAAGFRV
jgi:hypothetical protein